MNQRIAALRFITSCLSEDGRPEAISSLRAEIGSGKLSWEAVVSLANDHLLTPALWVTLNRKGLVEELPDDLCHYLRELHQLSKERNAHLQTQLLEAVQQLNSINIVPVLLKGAMHLVSDVYSDTGVRIMSDIDLLVAREDVDKCLTALKELGYQTEPDSEHDYPEHHHHCAPLFRPGDYASLEIHREPMEGAAEILPAKLALAQAEALLFRGHSMKVLSPAHRALHNILHSQMTDRNYSAGRIPLRSLHEVVTESNTYGDRLDWSLLRMLLQGHNRKILRTYLYLAHRLFGMPHPSAIRIVPDCHLYYLRCYAQFGWDWADAWGVRAGRFSVDRIRKRYACKENWMAVNRARLQELKHSMCSYISRRRTGLRDGP
jgi:hypothetical protein